MSEILQHFNDNVFQDDENGEEVFELNNNNHNLTSIEMQRTPYEVEPEPDEDELPDVPVAEPDLDDPKVQLQLVKEIRQYAMSRLKKYLVSYDLSEENLRSMSVEELRRLKETIRYECSVFGSGAIVQTMACAAVEGIEYAGTNYLGLKLQGYAQTLRANEQFLDLVEEVRLKHMNMIYVEPEVRLGLLLMGTAAFIHNTNSAVTQCGQIFDAPVPDKIQEHSKDL